jgi:purine-nucleoside phosphorylase
MDLNQREANMDRTIALQFVFRTALNKAPRGKGFPTYIMSISDDFSQAEFAAKFIASNSPIKPLVAIVLGSGLGGFADEMTESVRIPYNDIPHFARSTAVGHAGQLVLGNIGAWPVVVMQGRVHLYEGYPVHSVVFPMRVFSRMGVRAAILTNAAGGINPDYGQGRLVVIRDHINLQGQNPLVGPEDPNLGLRFIDMSEAYSRNYRQIALEAGKRLGIQLGEGVYAALLGPSYETPAEIRFLRTIGADLVGMSTVPEVIVARQMGIKVLAISCVTNMAAGTTDAPINHEEVLEIGRKISGQFKALLRDVVPVIAQDVSKA